MNMAKRPVEKYDFKALWQAIKDARKERKESRKKVSDEMLISPRYLADIENKGQPLLWYKGGFEICHFITEVPLVG